MNRIITFFATGCYAGNIPVAPGTWGTVVGLALYWLIRTLPAPAYGATVVAFIAFAVWISDQASRIFGEEDPQQVVIDEIAGILVTLAFLHPSLKVAMAGFVLFRLFDITKPPPIRWIERRFAGGLGIVFDDVAAGVYANIMLRLLVFLLPMAGIKW
ncbi:MAG: phosphatidylglycerophosphatase A [Pseudomonadota bacterium]